MRENRFQSGVAVLDLAESSAKLTSGILVDAKDQADNTFPLIIALTSAAEFLTKALEQDPKRLHAVLTGDGESEAAMIPPLLESIVEMRKSIGHQTAVDLLKLTAENPIPFTALYAVANLHQIDAGEGKMAMDKFLLREDLNSRAIESARLIRAEWEQG